jgi:hypothetical protein
MTVYEDLRALRELLASPSRWTVEKGRGNEEADCPANPAFDGLQP